MSDDHIDRELRALTDGSVGDARFREPSARERAKLARASARRAKREGKRLRGGRGGRRRRASAFRLTAAVVVPLALVGAGLYVAHDLHGHGAAVTADAGTTSATQSPSPSVPGGQSASGPSGSAAGYERLFAGTPAATWADGAAGIVLPAAKPAGPFSAKQVGDAYATVKKLLVDGNLNRSVLLGGKPAAYAALLATWDRKDFLRGLNAKGKDKRGDTRNTHSWIAAFAPGSAELVGDVIKVHGLMWATATHESGRALLAIHVDYLFVYPVEPPGNPTDRMRIVDHDSGYFGFAHWDGPGSPFAPEDRTSTSNSGANCIYDGYIHPDYPRAPKAGATPTGKPVDPYSLATPASSKKATCGRTTGT